MKVFHISQWNKLSQEERDRIDNLDPVDWLGYMVVNKWSIYFKYKYIDPIKHNCWYPITRRFHNLLCVIHGYLIWNNYPTCQGFAGPCFKIGYTYKQRTQYIDESQNWVHYCPECAEENDDHWNEMWSDYYQSCRVELL